jgi:hypothetical protein
MAWKLSRESHKFPTSLLKVDAVRAGGWVLLGLEVVEREPEIPEQRVA